MFYCLVIQARHHFMHGVSLQWWRWRWNTCWVKFFFRLLYNSRGHINCMLVVATQRRVCVLTMHSQIKSKAHSKLSTISAKTFLMCQMFLGGWGLLTLWDPSVLSVGRGPLRPEGRSRKRSRASTTQPITTMGSVRSSPPPACPLGPGTEKRDNPTASSMTQIAVQQLFNMTHWYFFFSWKK